MAELLAEAFLSIAFEKLFEQLASPELRKNSVASKLKELEGKLKKARLLVDDAEDRQVSEPSVKEWLDELKHLVFMAEDLVVEFNNSKKEERSGRKIVTGAIKSVYRSLTKAVQGEIEMILADLEVLLDRAIVLGLKHGGGDSQISRYSPRLIPPLREEHHVFGRESDKEEILKILLSDDVLGHKIGVLPIVGMGGLGKTTLTQLVYEDDRVKDHNFMLKAWVTVSTDFDVVRIIKAVLKQVNPEVLKDDVEEPTHLQRLMKEALRGKRFLFVLDDVWDESYDNWDVLMSNFTTGDSRSRIIVTSRSRDVGAVVKTGPMYELEHVSDDDCWSIFVHHAFNGDTNADSRLQEIGRRIVEKCKGVPLAVKSVGGLLRSERNPEKWESILRSHVWEWSKNRETNNGILPSLWLSYRYLPSSLKQCFAYCSVFPQDYEFERSRMALLWMAEGFLPIGDRMEEVGEQYFDDLISRSLFQRSSQNESKFVMHDFVHDLAVFVSGEFCFRLGEESTNSGHLTTRTLHLLLVAGADRDLSNSLSQAKHLRTFLTPNGKALPDGFVKTLVTKKRFLKVLSLLKVCQVLPRSLGDLKHLRYLNFSGSDLEELPNSICTLFHLQTLVLSNCRRLTRLPTDMRKLINLRNLVTTETELTKMPPKMGNLKELRTLTDFVLTEAEELGELGELRHLGGSLSITGLENVCNVEDVRKANLGDKAELKEIVLKYRRGNKSDTKELAVADALRPHPNLEKLSIDSYPGSSFPIWVTEPSFSKMVYVKLDGGINRLCCRLPPLGQLPSLKELEIRSFDGVENIGSEFYGNNSSAFPRLETLGFCCMENWKEWSFVGRDGKESGCFPRLRNLSLVSCPCLGADSLLDCETLETLYVYESYNSMDSFPLDKFPSLESLRLVYCPNLKSLTSSTEDHRLSIPSFFFLEIKNCPELESFRGGGLPLGLDSLKIVSCPKLMKANKHWDLQRLTSLTLLTIEDCDLESFPEGLLPASLGSLILKGFHHLKSLNGAAFQQAKSLENLILEFCYKLEPLPEQVLQIASLCYLWISECPILEIRYRKDGVNWPSISHIPQISISGRETFDLDELERMDLEIFG